MMAAPSVDPDEQWDEGFPTVNNPNLPYVGPIPDGISPGKTIQVKGQVNKNATKFSINLQCGENSLPYADAAFQFSPEFNDVVVRNTRVDGEWGTEEKNQPNVPIPFAQGESFELVIQCESDRYKLHVNGKHYIDYKLRTPLEDVDSVSFKADVEIKAIRFGQGSLTDFMHTVGNGTKENNSVENNHTALPSTPFAQAVKETLKCGSLIYIRGYVPTDAKVFSINLQQGEKTIPSLNTSLHITPRFLSFVARNTMIDEMWGTAEMDAGTFPFSRGDDFDVKIQCRSTGYKVWVGSKPFTEYIHRIEDFNRINCISIDGNVEIASISYTQEDVEAKSTEDQKAAQNIALECTSVSSAEDKQSIDSTNQSVRDDEAMEDDAPSEASPVEGASAGDDASEEAPDSNVSPSEVTPMESGDASPIEGAKPEQMEEATTKDNSKQNDTKETTSPKTAKTPPKADKTEREPQSKKRKLDDVEDEGAEEEEEEVVEDEEEGGAESDDSEKKDGDFDVERILTRRKGPDGDEYLLKWSGWPLYDCTWEPEGNVSRGVRRAFNKPAITSNRLVTSADIFYEAIHAHLVGSKGDQMRLRIEHDVLRNILCDKGRPQDKSDPSGWRIYNKSDLQEWNLPDNWWYRLDKKGRGKQVSFPIRMKIQLDWTPLSYMVDKHRKLIPAKRKPLELLLVQMKKRDYSI